MTERARDAGPPKSSPDEGHNTTADPADSTAPPQDLGFGSVVSAQSKRRLLNRDGSFNVRRVGRNLTQYLSTYHFLLDISWPRFFILASVVYVVVNAVFAGLYMALGPGSFPGLAAEGVQSGFLSFFFFSVHTLATIGYGHVVPAGLAANVLVTVESFVGLLAVGLAAGLIFARFARPTTKVLFSDNAIVAPYQGGTALEFRIINGRSGQIVDMRARVVLVRRKSDGTGREYHVLRLERDSVLFFPLAWTVVHPIDEKSPLHGMSEADFLAADSEILVLLSGFDESYSQTVHARSSYRAEEVVWGVRFADMFEHDQKEEVLSVDVGRLSELRAED